MVKSITISQPERDISGKTKFDRLIERNKKKSSGGSSTSSGQATPEIKTGTAVTLTNTQGQTYKGSVIGSKVVAIREVPKSEQIERQIKQNRERYTATPTQTQNIVTGQPTPLSYSFSVLPSSQITKSNLGEQTALRFALPTTSTLSDVSQSKVTISGKRQPTIYEIKGNAGIREDYLRSNPSEYKTFIPSRDLTPPKFNIFGASITEPGIKPLRELEYNIGKQARTSEIANIRQGISQGKDTYRTTFKGIGLDTLNTGVKAVNRPIATGVTIGSFLLTKNALGGGIAGGSEIIGGLTSYGLTSSYIKERQAGGSGSQTIGASIFIGSSLLAGAGLNKISRSLKETKVSYKLNIDEKGTLRGSNAGAKITGKETIIKGISKKGSVVGGKPYQEKFITKGDLTLREITTTQRQSAFFKSFGFTKKDPTVTRIAEYPTEQYISYYKQTSTGLKPIGEGFKYIDSGSSISASVLPQLTGRKINYEVRSGTTTRLSFKEISKGSLKQETTSKGFTTKFDLKIKDVTTRNALATDEITKTRQYGFKVDTKSGGFVTEFKGAGAEFTKPKFSFDKQVTNYKDISSVDITGNTLTLRATRYPRLFESGSFQRTGTGTVTITQNKPSLSFNFVELGKKGNLYITKSQATQPLINIKYASGGLFNYGSPLIKNIGQGSGLSIISTGFIQNQYSQPTTKQKSKLSLSTKPIVSVGLKNDFVSLPESRQRQQPKLKLDLSPISLTITNQKVGLATSQRTLQSTIQTPKTQFVGSSLLNLNYNFRVNIETPKPGPKTPVGLPVLLPDIGLNLGKSKSRSKAIKSQSRYRPSLEAVAFNIKGVVPKNITPFSIRPIVKKTKKGKKK